jgi:hypothetical protein
LNAVHLSAAADPASAGSAGKQVLKLVPLTERRSPSGSLGIGAYVVGSPSACLA